MAYIACYEQAFDCSWKLVVYKDGLPAKSVNGASINRYGSFVVPDSCLRDTSPDIQTVDMSSVAELFPPPVDS